MAAGANPFVSVPDDTHGVIEELFAAIYGGGDWDDRHEEWLAQWREARGDAAVTEWRWWVGEAAADEPYSHEVASRDEAIEVGKREYHAEGRFRIAEARSWADRVKEGEEIEHFAHARNAEMIEVAAND